jgi:hypothetical protein
LTRSNGAYRLLLVALIGFVFVVVANLWVKQGALITLSCQVAMSVPPIPAVGVLLLLLPLIPLTRRFGLDRREVMAIYCFLTLAVALTSGAAMRFFLPALTTPSYFASPENNFAQFLDHIPHWMVPHGETVIRDYFEGSATGATPWAEWLGPLGIWMLFFVCFFGFLICTAAIFRPVWEDNEHLAYPVAEVPLMIAGYREDTQMMWRDGIFWVGFGLICIHHLLNILNAFNPAVTCLGLSTDLGALLQEWPLSALRPLVFRYYPFVFGVAYLMPTDIALSTVVFYFGYMKALALGGAMAGINTPGFPFTMEQASGAFLGMALILGYGARHRFAEVFSRLTGASNSSKLLPVAMIACLVGVYIFCRISGMSTWLFVVFYTLLLAFAISAARIRTEGGFASNWTFPLEQAQSALINFAGTDRLKAMVGMQGLTALTTQYYLTRGYMPQLMAFMADAFKIGGQAKITTRRMGVLLLLAVIIGTGVSWWMHVSTSYQYGSNILEGGTTSGGTRVVLMRRAYEDLATWNIASEGPDRSRATAAIVGLVIVLAVAALRRAFLRFPLHPLGFLMCLTGGGVNAWGPLASIVIVKGIILRLGGMRLYRRLIPLFIGMAIGDFFAAGLVWSLIASFGGEGFNNYPVWF